MAEIEHVPEDFVPLVICWIIERTLLTTIQSKSFFWFLYFDFLFLGASGAVWITSMVHRACVWSSRFSYWNGRWCQASRVIWTVRFQLLKVQRWFGDLIWSPEHLVVFVTHEIVRKLRSTHRSHFAFFSVHLLFFFKIKENMSSLKRKVRYALLIYFSYGIYIILIQFLN